LGLKFPGLESGEIGGRGLVEALLAVDVGMDFTDRKSEPIVGRLIFQTSHFTNLEEVTIQGSCGKDAAAETQPGHYLPGATALLFLPMSPQQPFKDK
jgi:hypothetical protein